MGKQPLDLSKRVCPVWNCPSNNCNYEEKPPIIVSPSKHWELQCSMCGYAGVNSDFPEV